MKITFAIVMEGEQNKEHYAATKQNTKSKDVEEAAKIEHAEVKKGNEQASVPEGLCTEVRMPWQ